MHVRIKEIIEQFFIANLHMGTLKQLALFKDPPYQCLGRGYSSFLQLEEDILKKSCIQGSRKYLEIPFRKNGKK